MSAGSNGIAATARYRTPAFFASAGAYGCGVCEAGLLPPDGAFSRDCLRHGWRTRIATKLRSNMHNWKRVLIHSHGWVRQILKMPCRLRTSPLPGPNAELIGLDMLVC